MNKIGVKVVAMSLVLAMVFAMLPGMATPAMAATAEAGNDGWEVELPYLDVEITYLDIEFEVIENTRELTIVRVNDILITQELDTIHSTREQAKAVLRIEDINTREVLEEIKIITSYKAGEYTTTFYEGERILNTVTTQFEPLKPGVLLERNLKEKSSTMGVLQGESQNRFSPLGGLRTFRWDNVWFVYGANRDINYSRPCVVINNICRFDNRMIRGTRLAHIQISYGITSDIMVFPPIVVAGLLGAIIGTKVFPGWGTAIGGIIGGAIGGLTGVQLRQILVDDRGTIWMNVHRSLRWWPLPPRPRFLRTGSWVLWDYCPATSPPPYRW